MNYSAKRNANKGLLKLQESQRKEIEKANNAKSEATSHEEKLRIQAKTRTNLDEMVRKHHAPKAKQAPKAPSKIDLKSKEEVIKAIESAKKGK